MRASSEHAQDPSVVKVVEMIGVRHEGWGDSARVLLARTSRRLRCMTERDLVRSPATARDGRIVEDHVTAKLACIVEPGAIRG